MELHSCVILKLTLQDVYNFNFVNLPFALSANENVKQISTFQKNSKTTPKRTAS